jgi:putative ABC transport system permease protein
VNFVDTLQEVWTTLSAHPLRTLLTSLSVAWGIFMLVVLLAAGDGVSKGVSHNFRDDAVNSLWVYGGHTQKPHDGHPINRNITLTNDDYDILSRDIAGVEHITSRFYFRFRSMTISHGNRRGAFDIRACHPDHKFLEKSIIKRGRFINDLDVRDARKVAVIGVAVVEPLFGKEEPMGKTIILAGTHYTVVGIFDDDGRSSEQRKIYVPITTAQLLSGATSDVRQVMFTLDEEHQNDTAAAKAAVRKTLAAHHNFSRDDKSALRIRDNMESYARVTGVFTGIRLFVWLVGLGTMAAGLLGVSNIMLITVKERTKEIGLRKALGATPRSIILLVVEEAILITGVSGVLGLSAAMGLVHVIREHVPATDYFRDPSVDFNTVLAATVVLVAAGVLSGVVPAYRAAQVSPVVALRDE